jgi:hypothetical protein
MYSGKIAVPPGGGIDFFVGNIFPYFFHVHLNILDKVVSSLYGNFGTLCINIYLISLATQNCKVESFHFRIPGDIESFKPSTKGNYKNQHLV